MEVLLIETLGERIRKLRKEKKLTLEVLAGDELTKGMLSLKNTFSVGKGEVRLGKTAVQVFIRRC